MKLRETEEGQQKEKTRESEVWEHRKEKNDVQLRCIAEEVKMKGEMDNCYL